MNKVILTGNLVRDPEFHGEGERPRVNIRIAYNRRREDAAQFFDIVAFGSTAEFINNYFKMGSRILVEGHLSSGSYDKADGSKAYYTNVIAEAVEFAGGKPTNE